MDDGRARAVTAEDDPTGDRARSEDHSEVERRSDDTRSRGAGSQTTDAGRAI